MLIMDMLNKSKGADDPDSIVPGFISSKMSRSQQSYGWLAALPPV